MEGTFPRVGNYTNFLLPLPWGAHIIEALFERISSPSFCLSYKLVLPYSLKFILANTDSVSEVRLHSVIVLLRFCNIFWIPNVV